MTITTNPAVALLARCEALAVFLQADGERLRFDGPADALTAELLAKLQEHKPGLLEILRTRGDTAGGPDHLARPAVCAALQLVDGESGPDVTAETLAARCPVCGSSRRVCGTRSVWCRSCADVGRETRLGDLQALPAAVADETGGAVPSDDQAGGDFGDDDHGDAGGDGQPLPPWPPVVPADIKADPIPDCRSCGRPAVRPRSPDGLCIRCWLQTGCETGPETNESPKV